MPVQWAQMRFGISDSLRQLRGWRYPVQGLDSSAPGLVPEADARADKSLSTFPVVGQFEIFAGL